MRVNKAELAQILGVSLPTLGVYMARHGEAFPVVEKGGRGRDWVFDHEAVQTFLNGKRAEQEAGDAERQTALQQLALPLGHNGGPAMDAEPGLSPSELLTLWKVRRIQREEGYACGRLVEAAKLQAKMQELLGTMNRMLRVTVHQFGRTHDFSPALINELDEALKQGQRTFVSDMKNVCATGEAQPSLFPDAAE